MSRTFAYCRVSTLDQCPENQIGEIRTAGFHVDHHRVVMEYVSGSTAATQRPQFGRLLDRLEADDVLIVSKLDRLGRSAPDVRATVELLAARGVKTHCLALGGVDLTSSAGRMTMQVISAVAEFELDLLRERVNAGLARAKAQGIKLGRKPALSDQQREQVLQQLAAGVTVSALARQYATTRQTIIRTRNRATP
jgi:putative DNA-invertase from lambdoid prophage Rac